MQITYVFSKNKKIGSWLIRVGSFWEVNIPFKNTPSHVAILIKRRWVVESTVSSGFRVIPYSKWLKLNEQIIEIPAAHNLSMDTIKEMYRPLKGKRYDWTGVLYLTWRLALKAILGLEIPKENKWQSSDAYFCSEVVAKLSGESYSMTTPARIMVSLWKEHVRRG